MESSPSFQDRVLQSIGAVGACTSLFGRQDDRSSSRMQFRPGLLGACAALVVLLALMPIGMVDALAQVDALREAGPSPTAASLGKFGDVQVGLHTGAANFQVPLTTAQGRRLSVPVGLSYHASGVRVASIPGWVGAGWSLNAGGVVTRTVRGVPDDDPSAGYLVTADSTVYDSTSWNILRGAEGGERRHELVRQAYDRDVDLQPDVYTYNVGGQSGQFILYKDDSGNVKARTRNGSNVKIEPGPIGRNLDLYTNLGGNSSVYGFESFTITTPNGTVYEFGKVDGTLGHAIEFGGKGITGSTCETDCAWPTSWFLKRISDVDGADVITFTYDTQASYSYSLRPHVERRDRLPDINGDDGCIAFKNVAGLEHATAVNRVEARYVSKIVSARNVVKFHASPRVGHAMPDEMKLDSVEVFNRGSQGTIHDRTLHLKYVPGGRLMLSSVHTYGRAGAMNASSNTEREVTPPYEFTYYGTDLPPFDSPNVDHWGYYNAAGNDPYDVPKARFLDVGTGEWVTLPGNDREPNLNAARKGALRTITYPTGGSSTVTYELHEVREYLLEGKRIGQVGTPVKQSVTAWATATRDADDRVNTVQLEIKDEAEQGDLNLQVRVKLDTVSTVFGPGLPYEENTDDGAGTGDGSSTGSSDICDAFSSPESYVEILDSSGGLVHRFDCMTLDAASSTKNVSLAVGTYTLRAVAGDDREDEPWYTWAGLTWYNIETGKERRPVGGLRVQKTVSDPAGGGTPTIKRYVYDDPTHPGASSGYSMREPRYYNVTRFPYVFESTGNTQLCGNATTAFCKYVTRTSAPIATLGSVGGGTVGYRYVTVLNGPDSTRGWTRHHFATEREAAPAANAALIPPATSANSDAGRYFGSFNTGNYSKLPHRAGFKKQVQQYDASGRLLAQTDNERKVGSSLVGINDFKAVQQPAVDMEFWQPEVKEDHSLVTETIRYTGTGACNAMPPPIFANMSFYYDISEWVRPTKFRTTTFDPDSGHQTWTEQTMTYAADAGDYNGMSYLGGRQPRTITESTSEGHVRETTHLYLEDDELSTFQLTGRTNHLIAPKVRTTVRDGTGSIVSRKWMKYTLNSATPREQWGWRGDGSGSDGTAPDLPDASNPETVRTSHVHSYDAYMQPTAVVDARGDTTRMTYNTASGDLQPSVQLHRVEKGGLAVDYYYDAYGKANEIVDENGFSRYFNYDAAGRLVSVQNTRGDTTAIHEYDFDRGFVRKTLPGGTDSPDQVQTTYVDGLGRTQQVHTLLRPGAIQVSATKYDVLGRPYKKYQPYLYFGRGFDADVAESAYEFHGTHEAYTRTTYVDDPSGQPERVYRPGRDGSSVFAQSRYGIRTVEEDGVTRGPFQFSASFDESGTGSATFTDALGRKKAVVAGIDTSLSDTSTVSGVVTQFEYDGITKQLTGVVKPEGDRVEFVYDRTGNLLERRSPDAGTSRSRYTKSGQIRFSQDANQRVRGLVAFSHYDTYGRPVTAGVVEGDLAGLDPDQSYAFDTDPNAQGTEWRSVVAYDQAPDFSVYPWSQVGASGLTLQNGKGRMVAQAVRVTPPETMTVTGGQTIEGTQLESAQTTLTAGPATVAAGASLTMEAGQSVTLQPGFRVEAGAEFTAQTDAALDVSDPDWRFTFVSYDDLGRIDTKVLFAPGAPGGGQQTFSYDYDRQGRMTYRRVDAGGSTLHTRYEYNAAGLVEAVYASTTDPAPNVPEVEYTYTADGQIDRVLYRSIQPIERNYNVRGELTSIGNVETGEAAFNAAYHYGLDGSIQEIEVHQPVFNGNHRFRRTFSYDSLDRLTGANYSAHDGSGYTSTTLYDLRNVQYDENGNILALERRGETGAKVDELSYMYDAARPNRLQSVSDAVAPTSFDWDAEDGGFTYDAGGNATSLPAPHGATQVAYDDANLPIRMQTPEGLSRYRYSGDGQRTYVRRPDGTVEHHVREGSALVGRFANGQLRHWNVLLPSGTVIGRLPQ